MNNTPLDALAIAYRLLERPGPNDWVAILVPPPEIDNVAHAIEEEVRELETTVVNTVSCANALELHKHVATYPDGVLIVTGLVGITAKGWSRLDGQRSQLRRAGTTAIVLEEPAFALLINFAPNIASWIGASVFYWAPDQGTLEEPELQLRLHALSRKFKMTSADVIQRAGLRALPPDPEFAEWLVLLGRGDLLDE
jgi:hypothetical protein